MSVAGATTVFGDLEPITSIPGSDSKGKAKMPTETFHLETFNKPSFQVGP